MGYYEFIVSVPDESREAVTYKLNEMGSTGYFEQAVNIVAYFEDKFDIADLCAKLEEFRSVLKSSGLDPDFSYDYVLLPGKDWNEEWKKSFKPIDVGKNLTIIPSWLESNTDRVRVIIDPGMAFGTGHHETTKRCLMLIEELAAGGSRSLLDLGTGTGILAIGAARLGLGPVAAVDIDPLAVDLAGRNAAANGLGDITIQLGGIADVAGSFDIVIANLISELLISIAHDIVLRVKPGGTVILSGMISGQEDRVIEAVTREGLVLENRYLDDKWVTLVCRG